MTEISYDEQEDVLYVSFTPKPQKALGELHGDFIIRVDNEDRVVGVTILNATSHFKREIKKIGIGMKWILD